VEIPVKSKSLFGKQTVILELKKAGISFLSVSFCE